MADKLAAAERVFGFWICDADLLFEVFLL